MQHHVTQPRFSLIIALVILITGSVTGCGEDEMAADDREATIEKLLALTEQEPVGGEIRLDSATTFSWDKVYRFADGTPTERMSQIVGTEIELDADVKAALSSDSSLLIFTKDGAVVYQLVAGPGIDRPSLFITGAPGKSHTPETALLTIEGRDPSGGHGYLAFKE